MEEDHRQPRPRLPIKTHQHNWKQQLRENCLKRVREDRTRLLWKMRLLPAADNNPSLNINTNHQKEIMDSTFRGIVSDELKKLKDSSFNDDLEMSTSAAKVDDALWEYDGLCMDSQSSETEWVEIMIEMERIFYEDLREEQSRTEEEDYGKTWEEEEDNYLAQAAFEHMRLNDDQVCKNVIWCPICKKGELQENPNLIHCNRCKFKLNRADEVNLEYLRVRLGEAHTEHLDRGCKKAPTFCMETRFNLTALYIQCEACNTFEIVI